jgi:NADPH:quinone reductase-like Zn-dependent oxidoreductase
MIKAVGFYTYGSAEVLQEVTIERPMVTPNSVLIRVVAAGVNPADWQIRSGQFKLFMRPTLPSIPGADVAGLVEEVGANVTTVCPGDPVYALLPTLNGGGYAEYALADATAVAHIPPQLTFAQAAAVPLTALTALQALRDKAHLQPGAQILIYGASGGVGTFAVQIAKAYGARITATCSTRNIELVQSLGADKVIDYTKEKVTTEPAHYDVVFDAVNHFPFWRGMKVLRPGGLLVSVNPVLANPVTRMIAGVRRRSVQSLMVQANGADLATLQPWFATGQIRPVIDECYPLMRAAAAHGHSQTERVRGKLVLVVDEQLAAIHAVPAKAVR